MGFSRLTYEQYVDAPEVWGTELPRWAGELSWKGYRGISALDFYDDIFGDDLEEECLPEDYKRGEYGGIAIERVKKVDGDGKERYVGRRYTVTRGNMELYDLIDRSENFCMIAPISYAGRSRKNENARFMYAFCMEVDHIEPKHGLDELVYSWERKTQPLPKPTYIVCSGNGLHLYYVFERPVPLWRNIFEQLTDIKKYLTPWFWNRYVTTAYEAIQYESINQPFRCVGSRTKGNSYVMAFECGGRITIEYLNSFLPEDKKLDCVYRSSCTLEQAKELYPEWYKRRIEQGQERGHFNRYQPIYYNWIEKIMSDNGAKVGHRYHCLENLCSLAVQCNIEPEQVEKDCRMVAEHMEQLTVSEDNHFTEYDILCALRTYHMATEQAYRRRIEFISKKTGIPLIENKRNGRKRSVHLERARAVQAVDYPEGGWRKGNGRPSSEQVVRDYLYDKNSLASKKEIKDHTGLSYPTIRKYYDKIIKEMNTVPSVDEMIQKVLEESEQYYLQEREEDEDHKTDG